MMGTGNQFNTNDVSALVSRKDDDNRNKRGHHNASIVRNHAILGTHAGILMVSRRIGSQKPNEKVVQIT